MKTCVLITTYNRGHLLEKSLERLTHLTLPDEILIVDDGSNRQTDATEQICKGFEGRLPIRYLYNNNPEWTTRSLASNIGIKNTDCDIIITTEPELIWVTDIIPQMLKQHQEHPEDIVSIGTIYHGQPNSHVRDLVYTDPKQFLSESIVEDYITEPRPYDPNGFCKTVNMQATFACLYMKDWLMKLGGWREDFEVWGFDDIEICTRLRIAGHGQVIDKEMEAIHQFHSHPNPDVMGSAMQRNEQRMKDAHLDDIVDRNDPRLTANQGLDWGRLRI